MGSNQSNHTEIISDPPEIDTSLSTENKKNGISVTYYDSRERKTLENGDLYYGMLKSGVLHDIKGKTKTIKKTSTSGIHDFNIKFFNTLTNSENGIL